MFAPPIQNMIERHGYAAPSGDALEAFIRTHDEVVLFFAEGIKRLPEADDLAVILPELVAAFDNRFAVAVVPLPDHRELQLRYRFMKFPTLVFLRDGDYLGAISGVFDWSDYLVDIERILASAPSEPPPMTLPGEQAAAHPQT